MIRFLPVIFLFCLGVCLASYNFSLPSLSSHEEYKAEGRSGPMLAKIVSEPLFGAIAVSGDTFAWGSSFNAKSQNEAINEAVRRCAESGANDCKAQNWIHEGCLALALVPRVKGQQDGGWGNGWGENLSAVKTQALQNCRKYAKDLKDGCKVVESFCSRH